MLASYERLSCLNPLLISILMSTPDTTRKRLFPFRVSDLQKTFWSQVFVTKGYLLANIIKYFQF